ncbi:MAG: hypothetical protein QOH87_3081, partial [Trebonia sp.]|nr:hypothetical protein [Trebonia sp.]
GGAVSLGQLIDQAFKALATGFPEDSDLRRATAIAPADRKDSN